MPAFVRKVDGKFRVVDSSDLVKNKAGTPVDGKGHATKAQAAAQARAINASERA